MSAKLPHELEKIMRAEADKCGIAVAKRFHDRLPATKCFDIPKGSFSGKPDRRVSTTFELGFHACFEAMQAQASAEFDVHTAIEVEEMRKAGTREVSRVRHEWRESDLVWAETMQAKDKRIAELEADLKIATDGLIDFAQCSWPNSFGIVNYAASVLDKLKGQSHE